MALIKVDFFSKSLSRIVDFYVLLPNDTSDELKKGNECYYQRNMKTLYLLHGYSGTNTDWLLNSLINEFSIKYNLAVIFPSGENSFYIDGKGTGKSFSQYVGSELIDYSRKLFGLSKKREDTFIGGLSMGGFGALYNALRYNNTFSKAFALSSALIIHRIKGMKEGGKDEQGLADYDYYRTVFGDLSTVDISDSNPERLAKRIVSKKEHLPEIYLACGKDDLLINENRSFKSFLDDNEIHAIYVEDDGNHDWSYWNKQLEPAVQWLINECK